MTVIMLANINYTFTMLGSLHEESHLFFTIIIPSSRYHYYPYFTDKEIKILRGFLLGPRAIGVGGM